MKNLFTRLMLVVVAAMGIVACQTEPVIYVPEVNTFDMTIIADGDTRTELVDGTSINWSAGDQLSVVVNNSAKTSNALESVSTTSSFIVEGVTASKTGYTIQAVYPADANKGARDTNPNVYKIETATEQTPSTTSFDGAADMLVAKEVTTTEQPSELNMQFTRLVALGEMTLTKFTPESAIKSVTFSTSDTALTGRSNVNLSTTEVEYGYTNQTSNEVVLSYSGDEVWGDAYKIYFTCFPAELTTGFTVVVETVDGTKYTKTVTLNDKTLSFTAGDMTRFKVNMEGTKVVVADNTDVLDLAFTGQSGSTYGDWGSVIGNSSSAKYAGNSAGGNNSIQLRSSSSNSGIVTTTSGGKVKKVVVTWNSNTSTGRTLNIYGKNSAYSAATDLYNESQGDLLGKIVCGTSTELVIEGDYEYIGMRSHSGAMYIKEIKITWDSLDDEEENVGDGTEVIEEATMKSFGWSNAYRIDAPFKLGDNVTITVSQGGASTAPTYYSEGGALRLYQNGATMKVTANGKTIKSIEITFANGHYYMAPNCGEFSEGATIRKWVGEAQEVIFTTTGTTSTTRAYITAIKVTYIN